VTENIPGNPLLEPWTDPFEAPPFAALSASHFRPAFDAALDEARAEIAAIAANREPATFENTIEFNARVRASWKPVKLGDGTTAFYFCVPKYYRKLGCEIANEPLGASYEVA
jgi:hypothetical protein